MKRIAVSLSITAAAFSLATSTVLLPSSVAYAKNADHGKSSSVTGNNGTLKVHEIGTAIGFEDNDPKVCKFNFEGFGFDKSQGGYIVLTTQGKSSPIGQNVGPMQIGPSNSTGYFISGDYNTDGGVAVKNGTYKATLYGKDTGNNTVDYTDVKAKSKVFKVSCASTTVTDNPTTPDEDCDHQTPPPKDDCDTSTPTTPETPETPYTPGKGGVEPTTQPSPTTETPAQVSLPSELPKTGAGLFSIVVAAALAAASYIATYVARGKKLIAE